MKSITKIILFIIIFSLAFWLLRIHDHGKMISVELRDLGGIPWLYSSIGLIFSILAAFTIQKEWEHWNELVESIKEEVDALRELWLWSRYLSEDTRGKILECIKNYLLVIQEGWPTMEQGKRLEADEKILSLLRNIIVESTEETGKLPLLPLFNELIRNRNRRLYQCGSHIPHILKNTLTFAGILLIFLSLFIGVKNPWIDYIFTVSIGVLAYTIHIVIDDLDYPFRPGAWHLSSKEYQILLDGIKNNRMLS
jgi:hypothetical protein